MKKIFILPFLLLILTGCNNSYAVDVDGYLNDNLPIKHYKDGEAVYFNPEEGKLCEENNAISDNGNKTGCMKWYAYDDRGDMLNVKLFLANNTTSLLEEDSYKEEDINKILKEDTKTWLPEISNTARLISLAEISLITNNEDVDFTSNDSVSLSSDYAWLFENTYDCAKLGCSKEDTNIYKDKNVKGYWTSDILDDQDEAWSVNEGALKKNNVLHSSNGIRPVITVSKALLDK